MKKLIIIIILIIFNIISYKYLVFLNDKTKPFIYTYSDNYLLVLKKQILLDDIESFIFDDYFIINSFKNLDYKYQFINDNIEISILNNKYQFPYTIKEKEVEEKIIYQYIPINNQTTIQNNPSTSHETISNNPTYDSNTYIQEEIQIPEENNIVQTNDKYFNLYKSSLTYSINTDISTIINDLYSCFETNYDVVVDYSLLNSSDIGTYPIYLNYEGNTSQINIQII